MAAMDRALAETYSSDYLVCGSCTRNFPLDNFVGFVQHKRFDCDDELQNRLQGMTQAGPLMCQSCPGRFGTPWSLLKHAQSVHALQIYLEQGVYGEGITSVGVRQEPCESLSKKTLLERCALPQDDSAESATFTEVAPQVVDSALDSRDEGDSTDDLRTDESLNCDRATDAVQTLNVATSARKKEVCCDSQECGISLMPITHEEPKKCCCAVVPKWRKRHMETKHMHGAGDTSPSAADKPHSPSIFIDLVPDVDSGKNAPEVRTMVESEDSEDSSSYSMTIVSENATPSTNTERSVIIQPGTSFSIPIRYSPATSAASDLPWQTITTSALSNPNATQFTDLQLESSSTHTSAIPSPSPVATTEGVQLQGESMEIEVESDSGNGVSGNVYGSGKKRRYPTSRPFKCDQCSNAFNQRIHLKKHQSKHTGVKPFKCGQCDYSTVERSHLKVHIRVHTGEKPFHCTYCEYATAQNSTLKIHLKRHHADTAPLRCPSCSAHFSQKTLLDCHIQREHVTGTSVSLVVGSQMGQGHLQQHGDVQGQMTEEGYFTGHLGSFTDHGQFGRQAEGEESVEMLNAQKGLKQHFSGESDNGS